MKDGIARAFAVKTKPVVVHCLTSAIQMSAWRRYTRRQAAVTRNARGGRTCALRFLFEPATARRRGRLVHERR